MFQIIPKKNRKMKTIDGIECSACNQDTHQSVKLGNSGPFSFYITQPEDIKKLRDLCNFALSAKKTKIIINKLLTNNKKEGNK